jgi:diaminopimelate decarboxylase
MTEKLEQAVTRARQLPEEEQDAIAALILSEIEDEVRWDAAFARSHDVLERLAAEAEEEDRQGLTEEFDPNAS